MIIALKGMIGSGKTQTAEYLEKNFNFININADQLVNQIYMTNTEIIQKINSYFLNNPSLDKIDKKALSQIVFTDKQKLLELEQIVHPYLSEEINQIIEQNKDKDIVLDCQIIDKLKNVEYDYEILCFAKKETLISRIQKRDNRTVEEIESILKLQEKYITQKKITYVINTELDNIDEKILKIKEIFDASENWKNS